MRKPFCIPVTQDTANPSMSACEWQEIGGQHHAALTTFFTESIAGQAALFEKMDARRNAGLSKASQEEYQQEAKDHMFGLRDFKCGLDGALGSVTKYKIPNILRLFQKASSIETGFFNRYHIAVLVNKKDSKVMGIATLERCSKPNEMAELACWKHPKTDSRLFVSATQDLMVWGQENAGYRHFIAHTPVRNKEQRGNLPAVFFAKVLGFSKICMRGANVEGGNGKDTHVLAALNWRRKPLLAAAPK